MSASSKSYVCSFCKKIESGYGNNDDNGGRACDKCNTDKVIPTRIKQMVIANNTPNYVVTDQIKGEINEFLSDKNAVACSRGAHEDKIHMGEQTLMYDTMFEMHGIYEMWNNYKYFHKKTVKRSIDNKDAFLIVFSHDDEDRLPEFDALAFGFGYMISAKIMVVKPVCVKCKKAGYLCGGCRRVCFCKDCQKEAWPEHKKFCKSFLPAGEFENLL